MINKILAFTIIAVLVIIGWIAYWRYKFTEIRYEPIVQSEEQAEYVAEIRNNITKQISAVFCSLHHLSIEDTDDVNILYQAIGYTSNLMIITIKTHWLKAYFDWHTHVITLEYFVGGNTPHIHKFHFNRSGVINTGKILKMFYKDWEPEFNREKYPLERLIKIACGSRQALWNRCEYEELLKNLLEEYAEKVSSVQDVGVFCALINVIAKDEKAREVIEKMLPQEDSSEEEAK